VKFIICGSREIGDDGAGSAHEMHALCGLVDAIAERLRSPTEIFSGGCRGMDVVGEMWAKQRRIPVRRFPADWNTHGKSAGPMRNAAMVAEADALVAIHYPDSRGTIDCIRKAQAKGIPCAVLVLPRRTTKGPDRA
jgi:hypothetical protein